MSQPAAKHESIEQVGHNAYDASEGSGRYRIFEPGAAHHARSTGREQASVQQYFDRFAEAMTSGDLKTMMGLWGIPALVIGSEEARIVQTKREVESFFADAKKRVVG